MTTTMLDSRTAIDAIGRMSLTRLARSKALWISAALAALPVLAALLISGSTKAPATNWNMVHLTLRLTILIIPPLIVGSSLADDIGEKSAAYLWSRALPRWVIVAAKVIYLVPVIFALAAVSATLAWVIARDAAGATWLTLAEPWWASPRPRSRRRR
jgi:ABC-type transport system involved in multi-copper enzyme maturation permease subunit